MATRLRTYCAAESILPRNLLVTRGRSTPMISAISFYGPGCSTRGCQKMLALLGAATIAVLLALILLNRCSPLVALITVPAAAALIGGFGRDTALFMVDGITNIAPVAAMFVFAIL